MAEETARKVGISAVGLSVEWVERLKRVAGLRQSRTGTIWTLRDVVEDALTRDKKMAGELADIGGRDNAAPR